MGILDDPEFGRWRAQADSALQTARLASDGHQYGWACFLCEQAAQLAVKGLLHGVGEPAWGHDLTTLEDDVRTIIGDRWPAGSDEVAARLSRHYIPTRYPDAHASNSAESHYLAGDAHDARTDAQTLLDAVDATWHALGLEDQRPEDLPEGPRFAGSHQ